MKESPFAGIHLAFEVINAPIFGIPPGSRRAIELVTVSHSRLFVLDDQPDAMDRVIAAFLLGRGQ
ncbi:MAG: hypothetical protein ABI647_13965 [Gemmatimonadota bacterium]